MANDFFTTSVRFMIIWQQRIFHLLDINSTSVPFSFVHQTIQFSQKAFQGINWFSTSKNLLNRMKLQEDVILCFFLKASFHFRIHFHAIFSAKEALPLLQIVRGNVTLLQPENCFMALYKLHSTQHQWGG